MSDEIHHVNPNCKDATRCFPHGEDGPVKHRPPPRWVETSPYRMQLLEQYDSAQDARLIQENAYGNVVQWDEANQKDIPIICGHGGSMWLCMGCALIISGKRKGRIIDDYSNVLPGPWCAMLKPRPRYEFDD